MIRTKLWDDNGDGDEDKGLPGQPWEPGEPTPDSEMPPGDGTHRK